MLSVVMSDNPLLIGLWGPEGWRGPDMVSWAAATLPTSPHLTATSQFSPAMNHRPQTFIVGTGWRDWSGSPWTDQHVLF